jgi:gamma-glutamyltranspeptidase/glutathione hydrolase
MPHVKFGDAQSARVVFLALLLCVLSAGIRPDTATTQESPIVVGKVVRARHGVVVAAHPDAARVGGEILRRGGNAMDAAVATAFALAVVEPEASGLGGGGFLLHYDVAETEYSALDYRELGPSAATPEMFSIGGPGVPGHWSGPTDEPSQTALRKYGGGAVAVPRMVAGLLEAHRRHGRLPLGDVLEPVIRLTEDGFEVSEHLYGTVLDAYDVLLSNEPMGAVFLNDGLPYEPGELMRRPDLAGTLRTIVAEGADGFYRGEMAEAIVRSVRGAGGILSLDDLASVSVQEEPALRTTYRGRTLVGLQVPAGAVPIFEALHVLEGIDLPAMEPGDPGAAHWMVEATKLASADRVAYLGDPAFSDLPPDRLLSLEWANRQRARIDPQRAMLNPEPLDESSGSTTHVSVIDVDGNMVALTQSINYFLGAHVFVPEAGILMNNTMADFEPEPGGPNSIAPGKVPLSNMSPLFVLEDGRPRYILGTPGGTRITSTLVRLVVGLVDWRLPLDEAVDAPRFDSEGSTLCIESRFPASWVSAMEGRGHPMELKGAFDQYFGGVHAIAIVDGAGGSSYLGVADPRRPGQAAGH